MITIPLPDDLKLPAMRMGRQRYDLPPEVDVSAEIEREFNRIKDALELSHGKCMAEIDLLIIDEMGKDISGAGIDPKIIGSGPWFLVLFGTRIFTDLHG